MEGAQKSAGTVVIIAPFCSVRPYVALALGLVERNYKAIIATTVEYEKTIHHHGKGRVGFIPLLGSLHNSLHGAASLRALERGGTAALMDTFAHTVAQTAGTNYRLTWEAAGGSGADLIIAGPHSVPECLAAGQKLNIPVAIAGAFPFDANFESSGGHHFTRSARAVEWAQVEGHVNSFRAFLGLRPQDQEESAHVPFIAGYSSLFAPVPQPVPAVPHSVSGFWRTASEPFTSTPALDTFLAAGAPPVFVGFGDSPLPAPARPFTVIAAALKQLNLRGLLAAPADAHLDGLGDHVIVVTEKVPLEWAMARCSMAIHHGGPTSLCASLTAGLPTIVLPLLPESFSAAHRLAAIGVGPRSYVPLLELTDAAEVVKSVQEALTPRTKELSREFGTRMQAEDGVPGALQFIGKLINDFKHVSKIRMEWQPDEEAESCTGCRAAWSLFNRRHHCRSCGRVYCANCVSLNNLLNYRLPQLVCTACKQARTRKPEAKAEAKAVKPAAAAAPAPQPIAAAGAEVKSQEPVMKKE